MKKAPNTVYIGYDPKERVAYEVLKFTIERISVDNIRVIPITLDILRLMNMYWREHKEDGNQKIDLVDGRPFSTEFSFSRFLVPALNMYEGWALYMDCDMLVRTDINEIYEEYNLDYYPVYCVKHKYEPTDKVKMDKQVQLAYPRKNWSSLMLWNCSHPKNKELTVEKVNTMPGSWLHQFEWIGDKDSDIGGIDEEWNWLDNHSSSDIKPKNVHFTTGGPWFKDWNCGRHADGYYASEWNQEYTYLVGKGIIEPYEL